MHDMLRIIKNLHMILQDILGFYRESYKIMYDPIGFCQDLVGYCQDLVGSSQDLAGSCQDLVGSCRILYLPKITGVHYVITARALGKSKPLYIRSSWTMNWTTTLSNTDFLRNAQVTQWKEVL